MPLICFEDATRTSNSYSLTGIVFRLPIRTSWADDNYDQLPALAAEVGWSVNPLDVPVQRIQRESMHKFPLFRPFSRPNQTLGCPDRST